MPPSVKVTDTKSSEYYRLVRDTVGLDSGLVVEFGIFGANGGDVKKGMLTIVEIAAVHEFGSPSMNVPSRSYLRAWVDENEADLRTFLTRLLKAVIDGKYTKATALELFASKCVGQIKARIAKGIAPEVKPATQARKGEGKTTALINTGQLRNSITYRIRDSKKDLAFPAPEAAEANTDTRKADATAKRADAKAKRAAERKAAPKKPRTPRKPTLKQRAKKAVKAATKKAKATVKQIRKSTKPKPVRKLRKAKPRGAS